VNTETLRYYERRGLLEQPPRTSGGYRDYPVSAVGLLRFVKRAQELGFTLDEVEELLHLDGGGPDSCEAARALAEHRRDDLAERIADLQRMHGALSALVGTCDLPRADRRCALLEANQVMLEVLHVPDCPNLPALLERLGQVTDLPVVIRVVRSDEEAVRLGMAGSPTLLVDGVDPFATPGECECGLSCRLYRDSEGTIVSAPSVEQLRAAITERSMLAGVLSAWRARALPLAPVEQATHRAILHAFATTGNPPSPIELEQVTAGSAAAVLKTLHDLDAIRLTSYGEIAVAYPFSATPTRHRVRIGDRVEVYAMCAVDALGIAPMVGADTLIASVDVTNDRPITVVTRDGRSTWDAAGAVVFIGADPGVGPSADCCCDYLNFFADRSAGDAWVGAHPAVPGQLISQVEAEELAAQLFGHLLAH
jgi:DNA-binding transcriptional MerR regulator